MAHDLAGEPPGPRANTAPTTRRRGGRPAHGEPVVDRALRLLDAFGLGNERLTLEQLSVRSGIPKATTLRLARRLEAWGALERNPDGHFVVGLRLLEVASLSPRGHGLRSTALPVMEDLHHATGQHVLLAVRADRDAVIVERLSATGAGRVRFRVGGRAPLHLTGVGLVLLAHAPYEVQQSVLAEPLPVPVGEDAVTNDHLRGVLADVRRQGVATASLCLPEPMSSVAAPVVGPRGTVVAALSVVAPTGALHPLVVRTAVVAGAHAVSRAVRDDPRFADDDLGLDGSDH